MVVIGLLCFAIETIYQISSDGSVNWQILHNCNYDLLFSVVFYESATKLNKIEKLFCRFLVWFFVYDILAQMTYLRKSAKEFSIIKSGFNIETVMLILLAATIILVTDKIKKINNNEKIY